MAAGSHSHADSSADTASDHNPDIFVCESAPGRAVFLESGNTHGWISTDITIEVDR